MSLSPPPSAPAAAEGYVFPASFAQHRLWFLHQFEPDSTVYHIPVLMPIKAHLNIDVLNRTLQEIVRRHESLRTTFKSVDGEPVQIVAPLQTFDLNVVDLRSFKTGEREAEAQRLAWLEVQRPFSLEQGPLLRATLYVIGSSDYVLLLVMHHIVSDGWSMGVLYRELSALYTAYAAGRPSPLDELPVQYPDFALWQKQLLQGETFDEVLNYWKTQLAGAPELLNLPTDRPRPAMQTYRGAVHGIILDPRIYESLRALARSEEATSFMVMLAAFKALLWRYTGEPDVVVGTPVAGRTRVELEPLIGFFVNTLVLRTDLSGDPSFRELVGRVRETTLGAYANQDMPFERLVEELRPERDLSRNPLFQIMFSLQSADGTSPQQSSEAGTLSFTADTAKFDLTMAVVEANHTASVSVEYNTDLFASATIERMLEHFRCLLEGIARQPGTRLSKLSLLTEAERQQVLVEWNQTDAPFPRDVCLHELFERQAAATPEAEAVVHDNGRLTYAELNARANRLAHALRQMDAGPETLVGLYAERSAELVVGLLGILKAGAAYLPLDPAYPQERLSFTLEDAGARAVVVTHRHLLERLPDVPARVVCLDSDPELFDAQSDENLGHTAGADNLAYVLYTSGSTGRPKGVAITHRSAAAFVYWARSVCEPEELAGVLASTSICFDLSVFELFAPLCWGGRVILAKDALHLPALKAADEVRLVNTVPSAMAELIRMKGVPGSVRRVNLAGEPLPRALVQQLYESGGIEQVWNLYGPTEGTTYSTCALVGKDDAEEPRIGQPIANNRVYLLDETLRPVPVGVPGDLYIAGSGLARGYLNRPGLTAERFIPDPFSAEPGARLYRTGDRARFHPDGQIEYLGRADQQVKLRGYRIELGEIEVVLRDRCGMQEAVVQVCTEEDGDKRLVAYVVPGDGAAPSDGELRQALKAVLPEYMVPSRFITLEKLPLLPNGKLDRSSLPRPDGQLNRRTGAHVAPRNPIEQQIADLFGEVLKLKGVGVHDNFFDLGGHSLLATRILSRLQQKYDAPVTLRAFFENPTVEGLALAAGGNGDGPREAPPAITRLESSGESVRDVSGLSDEEVAAMLETLISEGGEQT
jgi:amino acid adenylation domain-containing protein